MGRVRFTWWVGLCALLVCSGAVWAESDTRIPQMWAIFLQRDTPQDTLIFSNMFTGEEKRVSVSGERYTLNGQSVMYFDRATRRVMLAFPDGTQKPHPFIQVSDDMRRVDWMVSADGSHIAWTLTSGDSAFLSTITTVANMDGTNPKQVLVDGPRSGIRALPVAFNADHTVLYMDYQPDSIGDFTPFRQYAGLFSVEVSTGTVNYLPGEPGCFCGAGIGGGYLLRFALTSDIKGFDLNVVALDGSASQTIPAVRLNNYTQAGDIILSPDHTRAIYALAQIEKFGTPEQTEQIVFMLVDLQTMRQATLTPPINDFMRPVSWTEENTALLVVSAKRAGTWKLNLADGKLTQVAKASYLGIVQWG